MNLAFLMYLFVFSKSLSYCKVDLRPCFVKDTKMISVGCS